MDDLGAFLLENEDHMVGLRVLAVIKRESRRKSRNQATMYPGGILSYKRLMGMCRWMGSHLHDWSDYAGVAFSIELLEWGRTFGFFWGRQFVIFLVSNLLLTYQNVCTADEK